MLPLYLLFLLAPCFCPVALPFSCVPPITLSLPVTGRNRRQVQECETCSTLYGSVLNQQKERARCALTQRNTKFTAKSVTHPSPQEMEHRIRLQCSQFAWNLLSIVRDFPAVLFLQGELWQKYEAWSKFLHSV